MINGAHFLFYSTNPDADRAFIRDVLEFSFVDVGGGWLIFRFPPTEVAVHPTDSAFLHTHAGQSLAGAVLYLMCEDIEAFVTAMEGKGFACSEVRREPWGDLVTFQLPGGSDLGVYQPRHASPLLDASS